MKPLLLIAAVVLFVSACSDDEARFDLTAGAVSNCYTDQFPFEPTFFALTPTETGVMLRMEREKRMRTETDALTLILDTGQRQSSLDYSLAGQSFEIDPETSPSRAYFHLTQSCPRAFLNVQVRGSVSLSSFGFGGGDTVEGTLTGTLVNISTVDTPAGKTATYEELGSLSGTFRFEVHHGPPYTIYTAPPVSTRN